MDDNSTVMLTVLINGQEVLSAGLILRYAKLAVSYALESVGTQRMEDEQRLLDFENAARLAEARSPIEAAVAQFNESVAELENPGE